mmetsp:Transcript_112557/g.323513  ORF Transcript_112557/g.323513 Transcript_112557/m.323513 type:complete len:97 (+) Transcript_112557:88-378(+)
MSAMWSDELTFSLGGDTAIFKGKAALLDVDMYTSVSNVVEKLNAGVIKVEGSCCVVFSSSSQQYFLLYEDGAKEQVFLKLGIIEEPLEPVQGGMMG